MSMKHIVIALGPTSAGGDFTTPTTVPAVNGKLYAIEYRPGTLDTGCTIVVTCESDVSKPILTKASPGTSNLWFYPRDLVHAVLDGAALTGTAGGDRVMPIFCGRPKVVVSAGGNALTGSIAFHYEE